MLPDDPQAAGPAVDQSDRYRRHPRTDGKPIGAVGAMPDDLTDELMAEHDVAVRRHTATAGRIVRTEIGVIHEMDIRGTDRGAQSSQEQFSRAGHRVGVSRGPQIAAS